MTHDTSVKPKDMERALELMKQHEDEAKFLLNKEWERQLPGNLMYFLGVVIGAFVLNLLLLMLIAG